MHVEIMTNSSANLCFYIQNKKAFLWKVTVHRVWCFRTHTKHSQSLQLQKSQTFALLSLEASPACIVLFKPSNQSDVRAANNFIPVVNISF